MAKSDKLYSKSPRLERGDDGEVGVKKPTDADNENMGTGGLGVTGGDTMAIKVHQMHERRELHHRQVHEHLQMHSRHELEHTAHKGAPEELHKKHEDELKALGEKHHEELKLMHKHHTAATAEPENKTKESGKKEISKVEKTEKE